MASEQPSDHLQQSLDQDGVLATQDEAGQRSRVQSRSQAKPLSQALPRQAADGAQHWQGGSDAGVGWEERGGGASGPVATVRAGDGVCGGGYSLA